MKIIVADASFCQHTRCAGWAGAIIFPSGATSYMCGSMHCGSSNSAEMFAIAKTFEWTVTAGYLVEGDAVMLTTDSAYVHRRLTGRHISRRNQARAKRGVPLPDQDTGKDYGSARKAIGSLAAKMQLTIDAQIVPGHTSPSVRRRNHQARVMSDVDRMAREQMKQSRLDSFGTVKLAPFTGRASRSS